MSVVEKGARRAGIELDHDTLPRGQRTVKAFQRLIAAMRSAESEVQDQLAASERQANEALQKCLAQQEHIRRLEGELLQLRLKHHVEGLEALTVHDRTKLLELSCVPGNGS